MIKFYDDSKTEHVMTSVLALVTAVAVVVVAVTR